MNHVAQIVEMDPERDRKTCVALDLKTRGADRELAQWLLDHPRYKAPEVARWLGCSETRIKRLRRWAEGAFIGAPSNDKKRQERESRHHGADGSLRTNNNSKSDEDFDDDEMPTEEEADESWQNDLYDQACLFLERMTEATRRKFRAHFKETYP